MGKIIPVYKKRCNTEVTSYRPISIPSNINKIIEKMVEQNNFFYKYQVGFRNNYSRNHTFHRNNGTSTKCL